jgi:hypothetical protein
MNQLPKGDIWTAVFWRATAERMTAAASYGALLHLGSDAINGGIDVTSINWVGLAGFTGGAAFLSLLKCVSAAKLTGGGPSMTNAERLDPRDPPP